MALTKQSYCGMCRHQVICKEQETFARIYKKLLDAVYPIIDQFDRVDRNIWEITINCKHIDVF